MRFQTTKRVQGQDPELVLGVLEGCLRSLSNEVMRQGSQITLLGLGPSPRAINRRDTTVIDVKREDGATVIHADVRFQASAFLGMAAQDVVVKEKLDRIFDDLLARLGLSGWTSESEKLDGEAAADACVRHQAAGLAERIAVSPGIWTKAAEQVVPEAISDDQPAMDAIPEPAAESGNETEPTISAVQPETVAASASIRESLRAESAPEQTVPAPAEEPVPSAEAPANQPKEPVAVPEEKNGEKEKRLEPAKIVPVLEAKLPDTSGASAAVMSDSGTSIDTPKLDVMAETRPAMTNDSKPIERSGNPLAKPADVAPVPPAEGTKPLSATVSAPLVRSEKSAENPEKAAEEKKPALPAKKSEAAPNALNAALPHRTSPVVKPSKPVAPPTAVVAKAPSQPAPLEAAKGIFGGSSLHASDLEDEPEAGSKWLKWSAWFAAFIVLVVAPLVWLYMPSHPESAAPVSQPVPAAAPAPAPQPPILAKQPGDDPDPAMVVSDWEAAMNSRDAAAQAAFYADPVERYFLRHNLSRDEVKADKQAAINRRKGDWSVEMENVKVTRPDDNTAKARLIKHYTVKEDGKTASEWFVPSLLLMTRTDGRWQITSERDLGWATSMDELGY